MNKIIKSVIDECGGQKKLAKICNVKQPTVHRWLKGGGINAKYIPLIARATNGKVTESEILASLTEG
ncbi:transcriptional regulator [Rodentibacter mrazii]|uniref:Transcriptional regulator n=1 Tax=Rodentibacter mrazii TaxID=1908257 RepID=A0A1V3IEP1_9PAST|nr:YdaS family helix-turn-helix protein [Rodentibacter mrazii]OOF39076.1 transcriptional regulator [Rodentibacter mrazii]